MDSKWSFLAARPKRTKSDHFTKRIQQSSEWVRNGVSLQRDRNGPNRTISQSEFSRARNEFEFEFPCSETEADQIGPLPAQLPAQLQQHSAQCFPFALHCAVGLTYISLMMSSYEMGFRGGWERIEHIVEATPRASSLSSSSLA